MTALAGATSRDVLRRADGVQLIGEMPGAGYREPPGLVRRADGQTIQLTPLLYQLLQLVDGGQAGQAVEDVATERSRRTGRLVNPDNVRTLVDDQLRPLGLLLRPD